MWMKERNEHGEDVKMSTVNPVYGPSLRSLMPRAISSSSTFSATTSASYCIHIPNIPAWNQPLSGMSSDYGIKKERSTLMPLVSSRWNPTPEQLEALEEMYRRGLRTPSAQQIQQITAKLTRFGKIQGKNVFYWFQNHKARDRQKKRRQLELLAAKKTSMETRHESGLSRSDLPIQEPNKLPTPANCSTPSKFSVSINEAVQLVEECKKDVWTRLNQKELQQEKQLITANSQICLSSYMSPNSSLDKSTTQKALGQENAQPFGALDPTRLLLLKNDDFRNIEIGIRENQTLQLFPIRDSDLSTVENTHDVSSIGTKFTPNQFFEFLPMKNG